MSQQLPVVAAIPNYNMADELRQLLPTLIGQGYRAIFVLDDASTDNSREVVAKFGHDVVFVAGQENRGAGGNRNRILDVLDYDVLIHFIDADTRPEIRNMAQTIQKCVPSSEFAFIGGLAKNPDGTQNIWNYGPRPSLYHEIGAFRQHQFGQLLKPDIKKARRFHDKHAGLLVAWPNPLEAPRARDAFWCIEQNLVFRSDTFRRYGGFDPAIRETEIIELAHRMYKDDLRARFDPSFSIIHTEGNVRPYNRQLRKRKESIRLAFHYGIVNWLFGR